MNYNELVNVLYSNLPESVKISILENLPEEALLEGLNESVDTYRPILEVLDILAYSEDITEEKANTVIDEIFSDIDEQVAEEILEAYSKEKFIQYIEEAMLCETDAIGLKQALEQGNEARRKRVEGELRNRARRQAINNTINKVRVARDNAITGTREATEKAIRKGTELKDKTISKGVELKDKLDSKVKEIKSNATNKAGELKNKAVAGIKNVVGKVKDWTKKATEPSAKDYADAIGKKATENEIKVKPGSYADRYAKAMKRYEDTYGKTSSSSSNKAPEAKKDEAGRKAGTTNPIKTTTPAKITQPKAETKAPEAKKEEQPKVEQQKLKLDTSTQGISKAPEAKKEEQPKVASKKRKVKAKVETKKEEVNEQPKVEAKKEEQPKVASKERKVKTEEQDEIDKIMNSSASSSKKRTTEQQDRLDRHKEKVKAEKDYKDLENKIDMLQKEIAATEGKPSMLSQKQAKSKQLAELQKKLQDMKSSKVNESLVDLAYLLTKTNISESSFVEVMKLANPIERRKAKFTIIASKLNS